MDISSFILHHNHVINLLTAIRSGEIAVTRPLEKLCLTASILDTYRKPASHFYPINLTRISRCLRGTGVILHQPLAQISLRSIRTHFKTLFSRVRTTKPYFYTENNSNLSLYLSHQKKKKEKKEKKHKSCHEIFIEAASSSLFFVISSHGSCSSVSTFRHGSLESERGTRGFIPAGNTEKISVPVA